QNHLEIVIPKATYSDGLALPSHSGSDLMFTMLINYFFEGALPVRARACALAPFGRPQTIQISSKLDMAGVPALAVLPQTTTYLSLKMSNPMPSGRGSTTAGVDQACTPLPGTTRTTLQAQTLPRVIGSPVSSARGIAISAVHDLTSLSTATYHFGFQVLSPQ